MDQGQLWEEGRRSGPRPALPGRVGVGAGCIPLPHRRSAPETCPSLEAFTVTTSENASVAGPGHTRSWVGEVSLVKEQPVGSAVQAPWFLPKQCPLSTPRTCEPLPPCTQPPTPPLSWIGTWARTPNGATLSKILNQFPGQRNSHRVPRCHPGAELLPPNCPR